MRKLLSIFTILVLALLLVACNGDKGNPDALDVEVIESSLEGNTYTFVVSVNSSLEENLTSIAYSTATTIYEEIKPNLDNSKSYFLNITFEIDDEVKLNHNWIINKNIENPGLQLIN